MIRIVPVQEASIVIAISSVHRKAAIEAVHYCIDALKASVPIWKKVIYGFLMRKLLHLITHISVVL